MEKLLDWMESWCVLIPLIILFIKKKQPVYFKPVIIYLWFALIVNLGINIITEFQVKYNFPHWLRSNNFLYNIHSCVRLLLFSLFFIKLEQDFLTRLKKLIPVLFFVFVIINFSFFQNFFYFDLLSNRLLAIEAGILLFYCLQYYFYIFLREEQWSLKTTPSFWVVTGLSIFNVISFPIYLFYRQLVFQNLDFGVNIWIVQKIAFLCFCILTAIGFYQSKDD
jgi:hypothetical protein